MRTSGEAKPELAVNQHGVTVADSLNGFIGPQPVPEPLPEITADDVHLVCWQSLAD